MQHVSARKLRGLVVAAAAVTALSYAALAPGQPERSASRVTRCGAATRMLTANGYKPAARSYDDAIEDSGIAPDFCAGEVITNDSQSITIGIHAHNRSGFEAGDAYTILFDTDLNPATGGGGAGAEYAISFSGPTADVSQWNGNAFGPGSALAAPVEWVDGYGPVLSFDRTEIGNPERFNVVFASANGPDSDRAPDAGSWSFSVTPFALEVRTLSLGPARAGKTLTARALVLRSDFDSPLTEGQIDCRAKVAGHALRGRGSFQGNRVLCSWRLPTGARGQRLAGTITVVFQNVEARRAFVSRVR